MKIAQDERTLPHEQVIAFIVPKDMLMQYATEIEAILNNEFGEYPKTRFLLQDLADTMKRGAA